MISLTYKNASVVVQLQENRESLVPDFPRSSLKIYRLRLIRLIELNHYSLNEVTLANELYICQSISTCK